MTCTSAHCISSVLFPAWSFLIYCFLPSKAPYVPIIHYQCALQSLYSFSSSRCWSCGIPKKKSMISYQSHDQRRQPCSHCPLQKEQKYTSGTMNTWAGTTSSSNCWHWTHSVLTREKKIISTSQTPTTSKTESINRLNPPRASKALTIRLSIKKLSLNKWLKGWIKLFLG